MTSPNILREIFAQLMDVGLRPYTSSQQSSKLKAPPKFIKRMENIHSTLVDIHMSTSRKRYAMFPPASQERRWGTIL